ncbi:hypothetical protein [Streptomyces chryseus]|uniref:hypothetical protein n=1 Tax=Streptomyces chryseus TaxID=68186 RepID=UPI001676FB18|nr:hypothetical protein [Streptomyces chryseus]
MTDTEPALSAVEQLRALAALLQDADTARRLIDEATLELTGRTVVHADQRLEPRRFVLRRHHDVSGISGPGDVADGVLWPDMTASIRWRGEHPSAVFWDRGRVSVELIHGHVGATTIEWLDDPQQPAAEQIPAPRSEPPLQLRRAIDIALTRPVPCPECERTTACRCANAPRTEGRISAILTAVRPWLRDAA